jgi:putative DNA primase/helicase
MELWNAENVSDHSTADAALCGLLRYWTRADAPRIDKLFRLSKLMRPKWDHHRGSETYGQRTIRFTINGPGPLYDPEVIVGGRNDRSNCEVFMQLHGTEYTYVKESKRWLRWNSHHWAGDAELDVLHHCEDVSEVLLRQARTNPSAEAAEQRAMIKWANDSGNKVRRDAIESFARTRLYRDANLFDRNNYLLACKNGIVDLRTGDLRDGQPTDWITRATNVAYLPKAQCPIFDKFLRESMCGDDEMIAYIWRVMGYSITGDTTERAFFLLHGEGRNGKTTFVETLQAMLGHENGGYAQRARFSTFLKKTIVGGIPDDIAHLAGARLIVASEADEHAPLDTAVIKELTGGDSIRARHLHSKEFQFNPIFKLMLVTNHIPPIRESTYSLWDRLHYIGFSYRVPDEKVDKSLRNKLLGELEGILAKSVLACLEWQRNGLEPPVKVVEGRQNLYQEEDLVGKFLREKCQPADADKTLSAMKLYGTFGGWCRQNGLQRIPTNKWFIAELHRKNYVDRTVNGEVLWLGIKWLEQQYSADF